MSLEKILPMGFDGERFNVDENNLYELYSCVPHPGTRAVVWAGREERAMGVVKVNLYYDPPLPGSCTSSSTGAITFLPNRCMTDQEPICIDYEPLLLQLAICDLVERFKAKQLLPTEVTENEAA